MILRIDEDNILITDKETHPTKPVANCMQAQEKKNVKIVADLII